MMLENKKIIPTDQVEREQILTDLNHNFLVEAGAGSGKTSILIKRMIALIQSGSYSVDKVAAITFTRKAAIEMKERFQQELEETFLKCIELKEKERLRIALASIGQCYIGTIHSFCARILREFPIEANLDPGFVEMDEMDNVLLMEKSWEQYLNSLKKSHYERIKNLEETGIEIKDLKDCYQQVCLYPDVDVFHQPSPFPSLDEAFEVLVDFCKEAILYIPPSGAETGYDNIQEAILSVLRLKNYEPFIQKDFNKIKLLEDFNRDFSHSNQIILKRWKDKKIAKEYKEKVLPELRDRHIEPAIRLWREYCYYPIFQFIIPAVQFYQHLRERYSMLNFQDLLSKATELLKGHSEIRRYLQSKYQTILVDEFQDTDPIQAEMIFFLTGYNILEDDWQKIIPRQGSLFIVGDPQQSIYHFRRADITVYQQVKELIKKSKGRVVRLNSNFRTLKSVGAYLNPIFQKLFSEQDGAFQAHYSPMETLRENRPEYLSGVRQLVIHWDQLKDKIIENDAHAIAKLIRNWMNRKTKIARQEDEIRRGLSSELRYSDFMILLRYKKGMEIYSRVLAKYDIPVTASGSLSIHHSLGVREFLKLLRLLRDPDNQVLLVAVLRGIFFGFSDEELYQFKETGGVFDFLKEIPISVQNELREKYIEAFNQLKRYYEWSRQLLPIQSLERIMDYSGILLSASLRLDDLSQKDELYFLLEYLRKSDTDSFYTFSGMVEEIEKICLSGIEEEFNLQSDENSVRIMNLHKAKGLEAPIVFLAIPFNHKKHSPNCYIQRKNTVPQGHFAVKKTHLYGNGKIIAQPPNWKEYCQTEELYLQAEEVRLLYVAATRAKNMLVISSLGEASSQNKNLPWGPLLMDLEQDMILPIPDIKIKKKEIHLPVYTQEEFKIFKEEIAKTSEALSTKNYLEKTPSQIKERVFEQMPILPLTGNTRGTCWGNAVHEVLEYLLVYKPTDDSLLSYILYSLEKNNLPVTRKSELYQLIKSFQKRSLFSRIKESAKVLVEVPISMKVNSSDSLYRELLASEEKINKHLLPVVISGTVDLAFWEADGWILVDYKSDLPKEEKDFLFLEKIYQKQINTYQEIWESLTGEKVKEKIIYFLYRQSE